MSLNRRLFHVLCLLFLLLPAAVFPAVAQGTGGDLVQASPPRRKLTPLKKKDWLPKKKKAPKPAPKEESAPEEAEETTEVSQEPAPAAPEPPPTLPPASRSEPTTETEAASSASRPAPARRPKKKTVSAVDRDLAYYRRVADAKGLIANDRLYILYQLRTKHAGQPGLGRLEKEIKRWETAKETGQVPPRVPDETEPRPQAAAKKQKAHRGSSSGVILVTGQVGQPQTFPYQPGLKATEALNLAGGLREGADPVVRVRRVRGDKKEVFMVDPRPVIPGALFELEPGDIVEAVERGPQVTIQGMLGKPGTYAWKEGRTVSDLVTEAGPLPGAKLNKVVLYYQDAGQRVTRPVNVERFMKGLSNDNPVLENGDLIWVP